MVEVDRLMIEEFGITLIQMMENAGRGLAELSRRMLGGSVKHKRIAVICGTGNNGGGGMAAARHLHNWGGDIYLILAGNISSLKGLAALQLNILTKLGIINGEETELTGFDLVIDALIGYGMAGNPREDTASWIKRINQVACPVLSLDVPSGLDATTGTPGNPCIHATATLTLALPKTGLIKPEAAEYVGELYLADISVPPELFARMGIDAPVEFIHDTIIKVSKEA
jgi:NAD(P)H-hydrate epimerase